MSRVPLPGKSQDETRQVDLEKADTSLYVTPLRSPDATAKHLGKVGVESTLPDSSSSRRHSEDETQQVSWDGVDDPRNPLNWPTSRKWATTILISLYVFCTLMTSTLVAPALPRIQQELRISSAVEAQLVIASFVLSYAFGPFLWAPLSEQYGRLPILQVAGTWYFVWNLVCGFARNEATMIVGRVLSGIGGAGALAVGPGVLSDTFSAAQRGLSLAIMSLVPLLAPAIGPIVGGQVTQYSTWRWAFWSTSIFDAIIQLVALLFLKETHGPTVLKHIQKHNGNADEGQRNKVSTVAQVLLKSLHRPIHLLLTQPVIQLVSIWAFISFGVLFIIMSAYAQTFEQVYSQDPSQASLNYLSMGIGYAIGAQLTGPASDKLYKYFITRSSQPMDAGPELRLLLLAPGSVAMGSGLLIYAWTANPQIHWIVPNIGFAVYSAGSQASTQCTNAYIIDAYGNKGWSASAMAGVWALKSLGGFLLPLIGPDVQTHVGFAGANTIWAVVAGVSGLVLWVLLRFYGTRLRARGERKLHRSDG